jgi:ABC-type multidrug transport system ATPase subunit
MLKPSPPSTTVARVHARLQAVDDVSTVLEPGKIYLLLGPPKSGRTTLLKAIAGTHPRGAMLIATAIF